MSQKSRPGTGAEQNLNGLPLPPGWAEKLTESLNLEIDKSEFLVALNAPQSHPMFSDQGHWGFDDKGGSLHLTLDEVQSQFSFDILQSAIVCLAQLANGLPIGVPARKKLRDVHTAILKALDNPGLLLVGATRTEFRSGRGAALFNLAQSAVGPLKHHNSFFAADNGLMVVAVNDSELRLAFRPSELTKRRCDKLFQRLESIWSHPGDGFDASITSALDCVEFARWTGLPDLISRVDDTPLPEGAFETNPLLSAPEMVKKVIRRHEVSLDAAVYYLQILTLPDPTDEHISLWNGWDAATLRKVGSELVARNLVIEAKRSRAGRKYFLPGDWENVKAPELPLETWKMPRLHLDYDADQQVTARFGKIVPLEPLHVLFQETWYGKVMDEIPKS